MRDLLFVVARGVDISLLHEILLQNNEQTIGRSRAFNFSSKFSLSTIFILFFLLKNIEKREKCRKSGDIQSKQRYEHP